MATPECSLHSIRCGGFSPKHWPRGRVDQKPQFTPPPHPVSEPSPGYPALPQGRSGVTKGVCCSSWSVRISRRVPQNFPRKLVVRDHDWNERKRRSGREEGRPREGNMGSDALREGRRQGAEGPGARGSSAPARSVRHAASRGRVGESQTEIASVHLRRKAPSSKHPYRAHFYQASRSGPHRECGPSRAVPSKRSQIPPLPLSTRSPGALQETLKGWRLGLKSLLCCCGW